MADFYCDVSAIGNEYQAYADTPTTWGVPQDGNGKAGPGHAAAVAIATIDCASASASGAGILGVLGVTVSSTLTGSGSTLATNITTAINASATATGSSYSALLLPLNKLVFARVNPGLNTQVQIMLRIAGVDWNDFVCTTAGTWGTVPTMGAFAGGVDGPFGYWINSTTVFGKAWRYYGIMQVASSGVLNPTLSDVVWCRTRRSSVDLMVTLDKPSYQTYCQYVSRVFVFDDGTKWAGDSGTFIFRVLLGASGSNVTLAFGATLNNQTFKLIGAKKDRSSFKLLVVSDATSTSIGAALFGGDLSNGQNAVFYGENITVSNAYGSGVTPISLRLGGNGNGTQDVALVNCMVDWSGPVTLMNNIQTSVNYFNFRSIGVLYNIRDLTATFSFNVGGQSAQSQSGSIANFQFINNRVVDANGGGFKLTSLFSSLPATWQNFSSEVIGNEGVDDASPGFIWAANRTQSAVFIKNDAARSHRSATGLYSIDWDATASPAFPTRNSISPNGQYYSERVTTSALGDVSRPCTVFRSSKKYTATLATKTISLELMTKVADAWMKGELWMLVRYINSAGQTIQDSTKGSEWLKHSGTPVALPAGSGGWSYIPAGFASTVLSLTTTQAIAQNTEVSVSVGYQRGVATVFYIDPEFVIA